MKVYKNIIKLSIFLILLFSSFNFAFAAPVPTTTTVTPMQYAKTTPCPRVGTTNSSGSVVTYDEYEKCLEIESGANKINASGFFPNFNFNDIIGVVTTILLALLVIILTFKIVLAAFKWANNDGQDKNKKDAIKSISNGIVGLIISFSAYFVIIIIRGFFNIDTQLIQCSNLYFKNATSYENNSSAASITTSESEFKKCIDLAGKTNVLSDSTKYSGFISNIQKNCSPKYYEYLSSTKEIKVYDNQKLNQCFADELKKL
ncbi:MAG: hypothetical protein WCJ19_00035 [bacterium]